MTVYCMFIYSVVYFQYMASSFNLESRSYLSRHRNSRLHSYGDPDLSEKSNFYRAFQDWARKFDDLLFPQEPDIPGVTYLSPVEWAPWMETIWFGNAYDYRSAFFSDVMYSNNKPSREGALLYRDPYKALMIALLYQRYKRFDISSYSLSNATLFNIFGTESVRVGRYKVPLTDDVILCITDPLTYSETKRYLNSFNALKWFTSKFFQQKRKRQYVMSIGSSSSYDGQLQTVAASERVTRSNFFLQTIDTIEYGRMHMSKQNPVLQVGDMLRKAASVTIPVRPLPLTDAEEISIENSVDVFMTSKYNVHDSSLTAAPVHDDSNNNAHTNHTGHDRNTGSRSSSLILPIKVANSQYILENFCQSLIKYVCQRQGRRVSVSKLNLMVGGDGRLLNDLATNTFGRVAIGNRIGSFTTFVDNLLSVSGAKGLLQSHKNAQTDGLSDAAVSMKPSGSSGSGKKDELLVALVLSAPNRKGGIRGAWGVNVLISSPHLPVVESFSQHDWLAVVRDMRQRNTVKISTNTFDASAYVFSSLFKLPLTPSPASSVTDNKLMQTTARQGTFLDKILLQQLHQEFDLLLIKNYIKSNSLILSLDFLHAPALLSQYAALFTFLGIDESDFLNTGYQLSESSNTNASINSKKSTGERTRVLDYSGDFKGVTPRACVSSASDSLALFAVHTPDVAEKTIIRSMKDVDDFVQTMTSSSLTSAEDQVSSSSSSSLVTATAVIAAVDATQKEPRSNDDDKQMEEMGCPDIGFVFNSDGSDCRVLVPGIMLTPVESREWLRSFSSSRSTTAATATAAAEDEGDGIRIMLSWLHILAKRNEDQLKQQTTATGGAGAGGVSASDLLKEIWLK